MFSGPFSLAHPNNERNEQPQEASQIRNEGASNLLKAINNYSKDTNCNNEKNLTPRALKNPYTHDRYYIMHCLTMYKKSTLTY